MTVLVTALWLHGSSALGISSGVISAIGGLERAASAIYEAPSGKQRRQQVVPYGLSPPSLGVKRGLIVKLLRELIVTEAPAEKP